MKEIISYQKDVIPLKNIPTCGFVGTVVMGNKLFAVQTDYGKFRWFGVSGSVNRQEVNDREISSSSACVYGSLSEIIAHKLEEGYPCYLFESKKELFEWLVLEEELT